MKYDVTIGIPIYNVENYIDRTLKSALAQSYPNIEFLIVDDGSTDNSVNIVRQFQTSKSRGKDINILQISQNRGPAYARNQIIEHAQGEFLFFMDSDDVIREDTISLLMKYVNDGMDGLLVENDNIESLSNALLKIMKNYVFFKSMAITAIKCTTFLVSARYQSNRRMFLKQSKIVKFCKANGLCKTLC